MSILSDAWRRAKGEEDAVTRALGAPPAQSESRRSHWLPWLLCCLLLVVVVGLSVYLWRSHRLSRSGPQRVQGAAVVKSAGLGAKVPRGRAKSAGAAAADQVAAPRAPAKASVPVARSSKVVAVARHADSEAATAPASVPEAVRAQLPSLTVTVHVWNPRPAARFVLVDGRMYHEGDEIQPGLRLVSITPEGEVVEFRGYRITLNGH